MKIPKPVLAIVVLAIGVAAFMIFNPPHSICDTYKQSLRDTMAGVLFPRKVQKHTFPPRIDDEEEKCRLGNSAGACNDYFMSLRLMAKKMHEFPLECAPEVIKIGIVKSTIEQGLEKMARMAWGEKPPEPGPAITGWLQEFEVSVFCQLEDVYKKSVEPEDFKKFRKSVFKKLPGPQPKGIMSPIDPPPAVQSMDEEEIWKSSLFSVNCQLFL